MKKKLLIIAMLLFIITGVVACGEKETSESSENSDSAKQEELSESEPTENTLNDIESYLQDSGVLSGEKTQMAADMVGAINGFKYDESGIEVYEYDTNSEEYTALSNGEEIELKGMEGFTIGAAAVNGKFVLIGEPSQEAIDAFNSFE